LSVLVVSPQKDTEGFSRSSNGTRNERRCDNNTWGRLIEKRGRCCSLLFVRAEKEQYQGQTWTISGAKVASFSSGGKPRRSTESGFTADDFRFELASCRYAVIFFAHILSTILTADNKIIMSMLLF
jgi:hypothetical protein